MTYGLSRAGINVLAGIDNDESCRATYEANNSSSRFIHADITEYGFDDLADASGIQKNDDTLIFVGCSPCQYWSLLKSDKTKSKKTAYLLDNFQEFVDHFRPGYVVVENVPGILKKKSSPLTTFFKFLEKAGCRYRVDSGVVKRRACASSKSGNASCPWPMTRTAARSRPSSNFTTSPRNATSTKTSTRKPPASDNNVPLTSHPTRALQNRRVRQINTL